MTTETTNTDSAVTKSDLSDMISAALEVPKQEGADLLDAVLKIMTDQFASGHDLLVSGFGKFVVKQQKARTGLNPKTKEPLELPARKVLRFRAAGTLKEELTKSLLG